MTGVSHSINRRSYEFKERLKALFRSEGLCDLYSNHEKEKGVYVFSGIIRDFLLNIDDEVRDIDIVFTKQYNTDGIKEYGETLKREKNSFGGTKLSINGLNLDVWQLKKTWGIVAARRYPTRKALYESSFFNCSAILYDLREERFYYDVQFRDFLDKKVLDIVYPNNPDEPLCIVNAFYYKEKYNVLFSKRLSDWIREKGETIADFEQVQRRHYGKVLYSNQCIADQIRMI